MGRRRKARELALKVLFHLEFGGNDPSEAFDLICRNFKIRDAFRSFSESLVLGVWEKKKDLDKLIGESSLNWRIERMSRLDRSILRLATYEILFMGDIPPKVSINEALEMGKKYGGDDSCRFINGVLDNIFGRLERQGR